MENLLERFLRYVKIDTTSVEESGVIPSFEGERVLAEVLKEELIELGVSDVEVTNECFVFATIPASKGYEESNTIGLLAHLDTAPDCTGKDVKPQIHKAYDGGVLILNEDVFIDPDQYPELKNYIGNDIVTSDGNTLLGADDKAGIAIIMTVAEKLMKDNSIKHGKIRIAFTPDEEVSVGGASILDVKHFGADFGITVDGDGIGELNYETFNAYSYTVEIEGNNIHPAEAKGKMINACSLAMEFDRLLPTLERPEYTEGHEGFIHLCEMNTEVEKAKMEYIIRDFEKEGLEIKKKSMENAAKILNDKYGQGRVVLKGMHEYSNPRDAILEKDHIMDVCKKAFDECGIEAKITPIRGGTDGSTLAERGLPCPNLFLGGHNYHNCREYVSVNAMEKSAEILTKIIEIFA